ncbi:MAG TPA: tripartite tricarboxylate transporter substrate binding protein [Ramlibacter sp.]|uniref:Bug family tripartite tricarboxylate transporter substrate binding protein n=1 Tax=Ramlibacter sp. TaxID=1917967 RepID=UPI002BADF328|nr:tripartite tricarboxylate transporter substrate binding protein [Ramlibacter sp.]HVZ44178.1 tripartite tricarboxylate transporter substrate binding protein [Ramlibacter sp.]
MNHAGLTKPFSLLALGVVFSIAAHAEPYPAKPIRLVVPYPPGGTSDILARVLGQKLHDKLGQPVIVDNRPGAGGTIGAALLAKSAPDGYTIMLADVATYTVAPALYKGLPYGKVNLAPVIGVANFPQVIVTSARSRLRNLSDVIATEKREPGKLSYASSGIGTGAHLSAEMLNSMSGMKLNHVPYRGGGSGLNDVVSGNVDLMFVGIPSADALLKAGKLRALAVTTKERVPTLPNVPTVDESGVKGFEVVAGQGIFAPARTSPSVVALLNRSIAEILSMPDVQARWSALGASYTYSTPEGFRQSLDMAARQWLEVIQKTGIKPD